jgi:hypothetical protein
MNNMLKILVLTALVLFCSGCAYTNIQMPLDKDFDKTELGELQGEASTHSVLYLVSWGDSGSKAAADQGNVKLIRHADRKILSVLFGLYTRMTTVVYGD